MILLQHLIKVKIGKDQSLPKFLRVILTKNKLIIMQTKNYQ